MTDWSRFERELAGRRRRIVDGLVGFLSLDTVSQNADGVRRGAEWLTQAMRARGLDARVMETRGNPAVFAARLAPGARRTVLIYCHYDVKPAPPTGWLQPSPFSPVLRRGPAEASAPMIDLGDIPDQALADHWLYARGASDDKGPIWAHLEALELMAGLGLAPAVNLELLFEGEEEIASPNFGPFVREHRERFAADLVLVTDGPKHESGRPTVSWGARGVTCTRAISACRTRPGSWSGCWPPWRRRTARRSWKGSRTASRHPLGPSRS